MIEFWMLMMFCVTAGAVFRANADRRRNNALRQRAAAFAAWWQDPRSATAQLAGETLEEHARRVAAQAWDAGFAQRDAA